MLDHCTFLPEMNISHWFSDFFLVIGDRWPIKDSNLNIWSQKNFRQLPSVGCCFGKSSLGLWRTTTDEMFCFFLRNTNNIVLWNRDDVECRPRIPLFWAQNDSKLGCETKTMRVRTRATIYFFKWLSVCLDDLMPWMPLTSQRWSNCRLPRKRQRRVGEGSGFWRFALTGY